MDNERAKRLLDFCLAPLKVVHLHPHQHYFPAAIVMLINLAARLWFFYWTAQLFVQETDLNILADGIFAMVAWMQGLTHTISMLKRHSIRYLLLDTQHFWNCYDPNLEKFEIIGRIASKFYMVGCVCVFTGIYSGAMLYGVLPLTCWIPPEAPTYIFYVQFVGQICTHALDAVQIVALDCFFIVNCLNLTIQFAVLCKKIEDLDYASEQLEKDLNACIAHHNFLLKYTDTFSEIYGFPMLFAYLCDIMSVSSRLYALSETDPTLTQIIVSVQIIGIMVGQLSLFCVFPELVIQQSENVANAIYNCNWVQFPQRCRKQVVTVLHRSQNPPKFSALGLMDIRLESLTTAFQWSMTLFTAMTNIHKVKMENTM